jgi:predicted nucleic acid-binding protein
MILVDTSILIGYFKGLSGLPYDKLDEIIDNQIPFGINNLFIKRYCKEQRLKRSSIN